MYFIIFVEDPKINISSPAKVISFLINSELWALGLIYVVLTSISGVIHADCQPNVIYRTSWCIESLRDLHYSGDVEEAQIRQDIPTCLFCQQVFTENLTCNSLFLVTGPAVD